MVTVKDDYVEMEMDELNQHECMASLTALLQHMRRNNITPTVEKVGVFISSTQILVIPVCPQGCILNMDTRLPSYFRAFRPQNSNPNNLTIPKRGPSASTKCYIAANITHKCTFVMWCREMTYYASQKHGSPNDTVLSRQWNIHPMLVQCGLIVSDTGPTSGERLGCIILLPSKSVM